MLLLANAETSSANLTEEDWDALVDHLTLSCSAAAMLLKGEKTVSVLCMQVSCAVDLRIMSL